METELRAKLAVGLPCELKSCPLVNVQGAVVEAPTAMSTNIDCVVGFRYIIVVDNTYTIKFDVPLNLYNSMDDEAVFKMMIKHICAWLDSNQLVDVVFDIIPYENAELVSNPMFILKSYQ